jgi:hypothetical protein
MAISSGRSQVLMVLLFLCGILLLLPGCVFDTSGVRPLGDSARRERSVDGIPDRPHDFAQAESAARDQQNAERIVDRAIPPARCESNGFVFTWEGQLSACQTLKAVTVKANYPYVWVLVAITEPLSTAPSWKGGASTVPCTGSSGTCWKFPDVPVPCKTGPYTFRFMVDAINNDPAAGTEVALCTP